MDKVISSYMKDFVKSQQIRIDNESKRFEMFAAYSTISQRYDELFEISDVVTGEGGNSGATETSVYQ